MDKLRQQMINNAWKLWKQGYVMFLINTGSERQTLIDDMNNYQKEQIEKCMEDLQDRIHAVQIRNNNNNFVIPGYRHMTTLVCEALGIYTSEKEREDLNTWLPPK